LALVNDQFLNKKARPSRDVTAHHVTISDQIMLNANYMLKNDII